MSDYLIPNLKNAFDILDYIRRTGQSLTITRASRALKIPKTSALRILRTMEACGIVQKDGMEYSVGNSIYDLADSMRSRENLSDRIHPYLVRITKETGETSHICVLAHDMGLVLRECSTWQSLRSISVEGSLIDLSCSSAGKVLLAEFLDSDPDFINEIPIVKRTDKSVSDKNKLVEQLKEAKERGWAVEKEEYNMGAICVSVPLRDANGTLIGAFGITGPSVRMTDVFISESVEKLRRAADEFSMANTGCFFNTKTKKI